MPKDTKTLCPGQVESRAEVLMLMDNLVRHLNDEDDSIDWLLYGVPDGAPELQMTPEQKEYYSQFVDDFEETVKLFAKTVRRVCFKVKYEPGGFC
jgi:hypothetical protein